MTSTLQEQLNRFLREFEEEQIGEGYLELYTGQPRFQRVFAWLHEHYNNAFDFMNYKAPQGHGGHYNAEASRELIKTNDRLSNLQGLAGRAGSGITMNPSYRSVVEDSRKWLMPTMGSEIPEHLTPIHIEKYAPVFEVEDDGIMLGNPESAKLDLIGQGSYAIVHKYIDPNYGIPIARKKLRKDADQKEIQRFRQEYEFMKRCDFPYILKVFKYDESNNSYTMEYCDYTLKDYIFRNNGNLSFPLRRKMALEFLYAVNYLHSQKIWHRDLSYNNVLIHAYGNNGVFEVKLSDFGLAKGPDSDLTSTGSDMKGTIVDPALDSFKDFGPVNDIYAVGFILSYIFTGKRNTVIRESGISKIVCKCSNNNPSLRYQSVREIITAVQQLTSAIAVE